LKLIRISLLVCSIYRRPNNKGVIQIPGTTNRRDASLYFRFIGPKKKLFQWIDIISGTGTGTGTVGSCSMNLRIAPPLPITRRYSRTDPVDGS
jgi:hypothetical protein